MSASDVTARKESTGSSGVPEKLRRKNSVLALKEAQTRKEIQELQQKHVAALHTEIEDLKQENILLASALNDSTSTNDTPNYSELKSTFTEFQRQSGKDISELKQRLEQEKQKSLEQEQLRIQAEQQLVTMRASSQVSRSGSSMAVAPEYIDVTSSDSQLLTWMELLHKTKTIQHAYGEADRRRETELSFLRNQAISIGEDEKTVNEFLNILDGLQPPGTDSTKISSNQLKQLLALESQIEDAKTVRHQLEEHLAYLDRMQRERSQREGGLTSSGASATPSSAYPTSLYLNTGRHDVQPVLFS